VCVCVSVCVCVGGGECVCVGGWCVCNKSTYHCSGGQSLASHRGDPGSVLSAQVRFVFDNVAPS